jgi:multidrug efflux pump subunit AcrA (membrane-fusion protein)
MPHTLLLLVVATFAQVAAESSSDVPSGDLSLRATVRARHDIKVSVEAEGLLTMLNVQEGSRVKEGDVIGMVDDRRAQAAVDVARISHIAARERGEDTIEEQYATRAHEVAALDYKKSQEANQGTDNVIPLIEMEKKRLDADRARLQILKAQKDRRLAMLESDVKLAEWEAANVELARRTIKAKFDGEVQEVMIDEGEWVNPGDVVLQLTQFDTMWVESYVSASQYDPAELQGRPVTVTVNLARGRQASVTGHIVYVSQNYIATGRAETYLAQYKVRAEVQNRREGNFWLVRPGMPGNLTIHVSQPAIETGGAVSQR